MARLAALAAAAAASFAAAQQQTCDTEYECEYRSPDSTAAFYDFAGMCSSANAPFTAKDSNDPTKTYVFSVCGTANVDCVPTYQVEYTRGVVSGRSRPALPCPVAVAPGG